MNGFLKKSSLALAITLGLTVAVHQAQASPYFYSGPTNSTVTCQWIKGHWYHGHWYSAHQVCWRSGPVECKWVPGHWYHGYWYKAYKLCR